MRRNRKFLNCYSEAQSAYKHLRKKTYLFLIILLIISFTGCGSANARQVLNNNSEEAVRQSHWIEDIDYLHENLPKKHKNMYHSIKKEDFDKEIMSLKDEVPSLKDYEIKTRLAQIVASVGDAHTALNLGSNNVSYPIILYWFDKDLRIVSTDKDNKDILGKKLVKINNIPIDEIVKKIDTMISHENNQWVKVRDASYINNPDVLKSLGITSKDVIQLSLEDDSNKITQVDLSPGTLNADNAVRIIDEMQTKPIRLQFNHNNFGETLYWYKYIPEDKTLYFQYNQCIDYNVAKSYGFKNYEDYPKFDEFSEGLLKAIANNNIDKLIVDLRNNTGGNSSLMTSLVSKMSQIDKLKDKGKIFVIVGRETFSSGVFAAMDFTIQTNAIFYGEPTGGNVNGYGNVGSLTLPNSKLQISYSMDFFELSDKFKDSFIPDKIVEDRFDHYKKGIDDVYEAIKDYKN